MSFCGWSRFLLKRSIDMNYDDPVTKEVVCVLTCYLPWASPKLISSSQTAHVTKKDSIHIDHFPSDVPFEELMSTLRTVWYSCSSAATSSSTLLPPYPMVYSHRHETSLPPPLSSIVPQYASVDPNSPDRLHFTCDHRPPVTWLHEYLFLFFLSFFFILYP